MCPETSGWKGAAGVGESGNPDVEKLRAIGKGEATLARGGVAGQGGRGRMWGQQRGGDANGIRA